MKLPRLKNCVSQRQILKSLRLDKFSQMLMKNIIYNLKVFHAGTRLDNESVLTHGGRVLCVTALGGSIQEAQAVAYSTCQSISWPGSFYRKDIGYRAIERDT